MHEWTKQDEEWMNLALDEARAAHDRDEVPIGAVIVDTKTNRLAAKNGNRNLECADPTMHAEMLVISEACKAEGAQRLPEYDLYVTLEPCTMCAAAISFARIRRVIYAAADEKGGGVLHGACFYDQPTCHHKPEVFSGLMADEASQLLKSFFQGKRKK